MNEKTKRCEMITWGQVYRLSRGVADAIRQAGFQPDIIVAIARGGFVPARLLCDMLGLYELVGFRIGHYEAGARKTRCAQLRSSLPLEVRGLQVLLVDDCSDTGETLALALEHLRSFAPQSLKVAVLHHKQASPVTPDFYGQKVVAWRWLIYPWAVAEDLGGFLAAMSPRPNSPEEAVRQLELHYGIKVSRQTAEYVLSVMPQWLARG